VRVLERSAGALVARAVAGSPSVAAQLEGTRVSPRAALRASPLGGRPPEDTLIVPIEDGSGLIGTVELIALSEPFSEDAASAARAVAAQVALVLRLSRPRDAADGATARAETLELAGEALAAGADTTNAEAHLLRVAVAVARAQSALLWRCDDEITLVASSGTVGDGLVRRARGAIERALGGGTVENEQVAGRTSLVLRLGEPSFAALQLLFGPESEPAEAERERLAAFAVRAAQALRTVDRVRATAAELVQTRELLTTVAEASEQLSLTHAVDTAVERVRDLVGAERIAVYLREDGRLVAAAAHGLAGPHVRVADALLELALGPFRARGMVAIPNLGTEPRLRDVTDATAELGLEAAVALPLVVGDDVIGLLAAFPPPSRLPTAAGEALLAALAGQLAVAVQNARLHDRATQLGTELELALEAEREAARRLRALYEISGSFAESLSLDVTVDALARAVVEHLEVDAALIRIPDARRELLVPHAFHVADDRLAPALRPILFRPQRLTDAPLQRAFRSGATQVLDSDSAPLLAPFLEKGSTAALIPIATPGDRNAARRERELVVDGHGRGGRRPSEVIATLTLVSLRPDNPITPATVDLASAVASQAALAIDNARLYQQQKDFSESMQRSLLPQVRPHLDGVEVGEVYAPSARVELGGDLFDYVALDDGRLAVVLGDVTGHGVDAAADMAMAKYVFRTLVREHVDPSDFVRAANEVVVDEIAPGKFITLLYLVVDPATGDVACASAGHPPPRLVAPGGEVRPLSARGLALGIEDDQEYEEVHAELERGGSVVLFTDGVIEARSGDELYGFERLDALLVRRHERSAEDIAASVIESARRFAGGELFDDCAVVVVKRT